ncbi:SipW-dependent-type signal peptide-containing protein [Arthrobacter sp. NPDC056691]|uniref:SipW-dependent-type signal peptide-containing protein n=1 Tax=Arthrobacter sp. NPDC056691 TaxID=3345913 RepID=UPI00366C75B2
MGKHVKRMRHRNFTRVRAVLAGALVLGMGASVTLASWSDSEYAAGKFTASTFRLESSTESSTLPNLWKDSTEGDASLVVSAGGLSPEASKYAWLKIRTTSSSTVGGKVTLASSTPVGDLSPVLEYRAVLTEATCDSGAFSGSATYIAGSSSAYRPATAVQDTPVASPIGAPLGELRYCFDVRIKQGADNSYQGKGATVTWLFTGISN